MSDLFFKQPAEVHLHEARMILPADTHSELQNVINEIQQAGNKAVTVHRDCVDSNNSCGIG